MTAISNAKLAARRILGEQNYAQLRDTAIQLLQRRQDLTVEDVLQLHGREVVVALSIGVQYAYNTFIEGDIVEFGTATGATARAIARAMLAAETARPKKQLHLFDSFIGLPEATSEVDKASYEVRTGIWAPGTCRLLSKDQLFDCCSQIIGPERVIMHEGWFSDTVVKLSPSQKFSFVHFDGDLYQSTIDAIGGLLKLGAISNGAIICFDDWNCSQADPNVGERRAWRELVEQYQIEFSDFRSYSTMGRGFFIHQYRRG